MDDAVKEVEILLVEDNSTDAELAIRALKKSNLANKLAWVKDGAEALNFIFATGAYCERQVASGPKVVSELGLYWLLVNRPPLVK